MRRVTVTLACLFALLPALALSQDRGIVGTIDSGTAPRNVVQLTGLSGRGSGVVDITNICSCTLVLEGRVWTSTTWKTIPNAPSLSADGQYRFSASGLSAVRVRASTYVSGSTTIGFGISAVASTTSTVTSTVNSGASAAFSVTTTSPQLLAQSTGGVDETLDNAHEAFSFPMPQSELGAICVNLKRTGTITAGTVTVLLRTDNATSPGTDISDTSTGQPTTLYAAEFGTTYAEYCTRQPSSGLTPAASYWADVVVASLAGGGTLQIERNSTGTNNYATSANGSSWSVGSSKQPVYRILGNSGIAMYASSDTHYAFDGASNFGFAFRGICIFSACAKFDSVHNFGVGGTSTRSVGVRGSSVYSFGGQFVSTGSFGAQITGTVGGAQTVCSSAGCAALQAVDLSGSGILVQGLNSSFATTFQADAAGTLASVHQVSLGTAPVIASGFGTTPSIAGKDGAFKVNVGSGGAASQGVVTFGTAWTGTAVVCTAAVESTTAANARAHGLVATTTQVTITAATAWASGSVVVVQCEGY